MNSTDPAVAIVGWMFLLTLIVVVSTAIWAGVDAARFKERNGTAPGGTSPLTWFGACLLFWIVFFPYYLYKRSQAPRTQPVAARAAGGRYCTSCGAEAGKGRFCGSCGAEAG